MPIINDNISALITSDSLNNTNRAMQVSLERLSTGYQINHASDNAAGLAVSQQMQSQINGLQTGNQNIQDGIALMNIADGCMSQVEDMLQRMRELAVQASDDTLTSVERVYIQDETSQLTSEVNRIVAGTEYNGQQLLTGSSPWGTGAGGILHVGPNNTASADIIQYRIPGVDTTSLGLATMTMTTQTDAATAISSLDNALDSVNEIRANLGAIVNRLEHALDNQETQQTNMQAAQSVITDTDFATESTQYSTNQILIQSATAMLAQANSLPQNVLTLLKS
jgi:flagellin